MVNHYMPVMNANINEALRIVRRVLNDTRDPKLASDVAHEYEDKYLLMEQMITSAMGMVRMMMEILGLHQWDKFYSWKGSVVTLRLKHEVVWTFKEEKTRWEDNNHRSVTSIERNSSSSQTKIVSGSQTKITEYFWDVVFKYEILVFQGTDIDGGIVMRKGELKDEIVTKLANGSSDRLSGPIVEDCEISEFVKYLEPVDASFQYVFTINRQDPKCHTPRRNPEVIRILERFKDLEYWSKPFVQSVGNLQKLYDVQKTSQLATIKDVFVPVFPIMQDKNEQGELYSVDDVRSLHAESKRALLEQYGLIEAKGSAKLVTAPEIQVYFLCSFLAYVVLLTADSVDYVEEMLEKQLIAAIGKCVTPSDMVEYMEFHNRKLFDTKYSPKQFAYDVRREGYAPEGAISINNESGAAISTLAHGESNPKNLPTMKFFASGSTAIRFTGKHFVHGYVSQRFSDQWTERLSMNIRARQFSSFVFMVGTIVAADTFHPECAIILRDKDEFLIPLLLETIPTPKEFRDAIASLSPEQQQFAKAFRSMQLQSTLFAICVIPIKPQLENVLNLNCGSLTKEVQLTRDILKVILDYQIPTDLITYEGDQDASISAKLDAVKASVKQVLGLIDNAKEEALREAEAVAKNALLQQIATSSSESSYNNSDYDDDCDDFKSDRRVKYKKKGGMPRMFKMKEVSRCREEVDTSCCEMEVEECCDELVFDGVPEEPPLLEPEAAENKPEQNEQNESKNIRGGSPTQDTAVIVDYTQVPVLLNSNCETYDSASALRPTKIVLDKDSIIKRSAPNILASLESECLDEAGRKRERDRAMDLMDALSRSGEMSLVESQLHIIVAATHQFDKSLMETVIENNVDPISKIENSTLIVASTIYGANMKTILAPPQVGRVKDSFPEIFSQSIM